MSGSLFAGSSSFPFHKNDRPFLVCWRFVMKETRLTFAELALIAGTRAALGAGLGLLLANRLSERQRRTLGWTLFLAGAASTIPLAAKVLGRSRPATPEEQPSQTKKLSQAELSA